MKRELNMNILAINRLFLTRERVDSSALEVAITAAVKQSDRRCQDFIGVFVKRTNPKSRGDVNWVVKGIKFGRAEREQCNAALAVIVERMKREFEILE
jgi:hypothetical protein